MTEPTDIDDLIEWAKSLGDPDFTLSVPGHAKTAFRKMADALESTAAELRQERERADEAERQASEITTAWLDKERQIAAVEADLSRAREAIEKVREYVGAEGVLWGAELRIPYAGLNSALATYDQSN